MAATATPPVANYNGADALRFKLSDGALDSNVATVTFAVKAVNDAPVVGDQSVTLAEDSSVVIKPLASASDIDSANLAATIVAGPAHGINRGELNDELKTVLSQFRKTYPDL